MTELIEQLADSRFQRGRLVASYVIGIALGAALVAALLLAID
jgi:hypothetical protein